MKLRSITAVAAIAILLLAPVAAVNAATDWEGSGDGSWESHYVFAPWVGTIYETMTGWHFLGDWGNNEDNHINATPTWNSGMALFLVGHGTPLNPNYGLWFYDDSEIGKWEGHFAPNPNYDTCWGTWWANSDSSTCNGNWWGDLSTD